MGMQVIQDFVICLKTSKIKNLRRIGKPRKWCFRNLDSFHSQWATLLHATRKSTRMKAEKMPLISAAVLVECLD